VERNCDVLLSTLDSLKDAKACSPSSIFFIFNNPAIFSFISGRLLRPLLRRLLHLSFDTTRVSIILYISPACLALRSEEETQ
jgi:hypothetical protein